MNSSGDNQIKSIKKSNSIAGAITKPVGDLTPKKTIENNKSSSLSPSDEFRVFWGDNVDHLWFEGRRFASPFFLFIILLIGLIFYLCSNLLFSPGEVQQIFSEYDEGSIKEEKRLESSLKTKVSEEENLLLNSSSKATNKAIKP